MFKYYNNTNFFVSFRDKYLEKISVKQLAHTIVKPQLLKAGISKVRVKKIYQSYAVFELGSISELKQAADALYNLDEILACEWLQKKRQYGINADLNEMAKFKSKIKREDIPEEKKDEKKEEVKEQEKKPANDAAAEEKKTDL